MAETLLSARTDARLYAVDTDTTDPALTDSEWNRLINGAWLDYARAFPERFSTSSSSPLLTVTMVASQYVYDLTSAGGIMELTGAWVYNSGTKLNSLDRADFDELYRLSQIESNVSSTTPRSWGIRRITDLSFQAILYPAPTLTYSVYIFGYKEPPQLSSDSTVFTYVTDAEVKWIARLAAIRGAGIIGREQAFIDRLWSDLPQNMRNALKSIESFKRPFPKAAEVVT